MAFLLGALGGAGAAGAAGAAAPAAAAAAAPAAAAVAPAAGAALPAITAAGGSLPAAAPSLGSIIGNLTGINQMMASPGGMSLPGGAGASGLKRNAAHGTSAGGISTFDTLMGVSPGGGKQGMQMNTLQALLGRGVV